MNQQNHTSRFFGDWNFYHHLLVIVLPILIQNAITNFVGMLDNIMVGRIGTNEMSGVSIINQLLFVYNLCIFGAIAGAGIFSAQFYGRKNHDGIRETFRFKMIISLAIVAIGTSVFLHYGDRLIELYLHSNPSDDAVAVLENAKAYLKVMLIGLLPFSITQCYAGTLRECDDTMPPMIAGLTAVFVNLILNYILIFGKFGAPKLGVIGAAIATIISRFVEMGIVITYTHTHSARHEFIRSAFTSLHISPALLKNIVLKGSPLLINEALWSAGQTVLVQNYAIRGLDVIAALNISTTISNVFNMIFISMGNAISIIIGQELGREDPNVREDATRLTVTAVLACVVSGLLLVVLAKPFPYLYNTEDTVRSMATHFIMVAGVFMPVYAYLNSTYFILRSGGKTIITFIFDSFFLWVVSIPACYLLAHFTGLPVLVIYVMVQCLEFLKCALGAYLVHKGVWINNITVPTE
jgi:putative MATE family efflux protein